MAAYPKLCRSGPAQPAGAPAPDFGAPAATPAAPATGTTRWPGAPPAPPAEDAGQVISHYWCPRHLPLRLPTRLSDFGLLPGPGKGCACQQKVQNVKDDYTI